MDSGGELPAVRTAEPAEEEAVSLLTLSSDTLHIVCLHAAADVCSLAALGSVCKLLALAVTQEDLWQRAAHASGTVRYPGLSWRTSVGCQRLAEAALRPFVVPVPRSKELAPRRLRCPHAHASCTLPLQPIEGLGPLTHMEREWLAWFRRYEFGSLHVEDALVFRQLGAALPVSSPPAAKRLLAGSIEYIFSCLPCFTVGDLGTPCGAV